MNMPFCKHSACARLGIHAEHEPDAGFIPTIQIFGLREVGVATEGDFAEASEVLTDVAVLAEDCQDAHSLREKWGSSDTE